MPHTDATGYIEDLRREIDEPWFSLLCQKAIIDGLSTLDSAALDEVYSVFVGQTAYPGYPASTAAAAIAAPPATVDYLESLSGFSNFKLLAPTMGISFTKPISLIFGTNGSGKSSICDALKVLATTTAPERPLENVRASLPGVPGFSFKFRSDGAPQPWQQANGYGLRQHQVKHFDTTVAIGNLQNSVEPGRVVELSPFKLYLFEVLKGMVVALRYKLQGAKQANDNAIGTALGDVRRAFDAFEGFPLRTINEAGLGALQAEIDKGANYAEDALLKAHRGTEAELTKGTSEDGLKLLQSEAREVDALYKNMVTLTKAVDEFWKSDIVGLKEQLAAKQKEQAVVAETLVPEGATLEQLLALVRPAAVMCDLDNAEGHECPLCRQDLNAPELDLFKKYHELLNSTIEKDIQNLIASITSTVALHDSIEPFRDLARIRGTSIVPEVIAGLTIDVRAVLLDVNLERRPSSEGKEAFIRVQATMGELASLLQSKLQTIATASNNRNALLEQLRVIRIDIQRLEYAKLASMKLEMLKDVKNKADWKAFFEAILPTFTSLLRKLTEAAKLAYDELVIADFRTRLEAEYLALTEQPMSSFGVTLVPRGSEATVTLLPQIGGREIRSILSEGEQRIHALALFFAELESCKHSVIVLDDPVSSFDYNYVGNFCIRLRDWYKTHSDRQLIILVHSWEFFVQIQSVLNKDNLGSSLSVMVMENCAIVGDYTEKIPELKSDITAFLSLPPEPSKPDKEVAAGKMRRLIEAVINAHVFNHQRSQFKQKTLSDSVFQHYTKLVRLLDTEATTLRDLYGKLSITEHDDPRNAYVNCLQAVFQTRFDQIIAVEAAILARK